MAIKGIGFVISLNVLNLNAQWNVCNISALPECYEDMEFVSNSRGFVVSSNSITITEDGGVTWIDTTLGSGGNLSIVDFSNIDTGMICCYSPTGSNLILTFDSGTSWNSPELDNGSNFTDAVLLDNGNIVYLDCGGSFAYSIVTEDYYTANVSSTTIQHSDFCFDLDFVDSLIGFASGQFVIDPPSPATVFKTIDGGLTWYSNDSMTGPVYYMTFPTKFTGYGVGFENRIYKTVNQGESWVKLPFDFGGIEEIDPLASLGEIYFLDSLTGLLAVRITVDGYPQVSVWRTINGATTWYKTDFSGIDGNGVQDFSCINSDTCFLISCNTIYKTINGGGFDTLNSGIANANQLDLRIVPNPSRNFIQLHGFSNWDIDYIGTWNVLGKSVDIDFSESWIANVSAIPFGPYVTLVKINNAFVSLEWIKD